MVKALGPKTGVMGGDAFRSTVQLITSQGVKTVLVEMSGVFCVAHWALIGADPSIGAAWAVAPARVTTAIRVRAQAIRERTVIRAEFITTSIHSFAGIVLSK